MRSVREFGAPQQISTGFASCLRYCSDVAHRRATTLCTMQFGRVLGVTLYVQFRGMLPQNFARCKIHFRLRPSLAFSYIGSVTARHSNSGREPNCGVVKGMELRNFRRGRHLYSAGRPSRWASAHILFHFSFFFKFHSQLNYRPTFVRVSVRVGKVRV